MCNCVCSRPHIGPKRHSKTFLCVISPNSNKTRACWGGAGGGSGVAAATWRRRVFFGAAFGFVCASAAHSARPVVEDHTCPTLITPQARCVLSPPTAHLGAKLAHISQILLRARQGHFDGQAASLRAIQAYVDSCFRRAEGAERARARRRSPQQHVWSWFFGCCCCPLIGSTLGITTLKGLMCELKLKAAAPARTHIKGPARRKAPTFFFFASQTFKGL